MIGRKATPIKLIDNKVSQMSKASIEGRKKKEPRIGKNNLSCPSHLCPEAKKEWRRIVKLYKELEMPIANDLDKTILEMYCEAFVTYRNAMKAVRKAGEITISYSGKPIQNPWVTVASKASDQLRKLGETLLLDPFSRAKMGKANAANANDGDEMDDILNMNIRGK